MLLIIITPLPQPILQLIQLIPHNMLTQLTLHSLSIPPLLNHMTHYLIRTFPLICINSTNNKHNTIIITIIITIISNRTITTSQDSATMANLLRKIFKDFLVTFFSHFCILFFFSFPFSAYFFVSSLFLVENPSRFHFLNSYLHVYCWWTETDFFNEELMTRIIFCTSYICF